MLTLYNQIEKLYNNSPRKYSYYEGFLRTEFDKLSSKDYIVQYFSAGGKKSVISQFIEELEDMRSTHMVSAFFMGILLKEKLCCDLEIESRYPENYKFPYIWFLVCLFHDIGYVQENDWTQKYAYQKRAEEDRKSNDIVKREARRMNIRKEKNDFGVLFVTKQKFYDEYSRAGDRCKGFDEGIRFNRNILIKEPIYKRQTILNYLEFCKMNPNIKHYDHGIVGGFWLYDSLYRNYCNKYSQQKNIKYNTDFDNFEWNHLHFSKEQHLVFAYLADCIISHNMWPATESTNELYKKCGLEELTLEKFKKIRFQDNPILYILALVDTIEPIKIYDSLKLNKFEIWNGVEVRFEQDSIRIKLVDKRMPFELMARKIIGLDKWIDVEYSVDSGLEEIEIRIHGE